VGTAVDVGAVVAVGLGCFVAVGAVVAVGAGTVGVDTTTEVEVGSTTSVGASETSATESSPPQATAKISDCEDQRYCQIANFDIHYLRLQLAQVCAEHSLQSFNVPESTRKYTATP